MYKSEGLADFVSVVVMICVACCLFSQAVCMHHISKQLPAFSNLPYYVSGNDVSGHVTSGVSYAITM